MLGKRILARLLCVTRIAVKYVKFEGGCLIVGCAPRKGQACRCAECGKKAPVHDCSTEPRRWRSLDLGTTKTFIEYATVRVACPTCGTHVAAVPWAHHASRFTRAFEEQVAWLCVHCNRSVVASLMRIDWKSVGPVCGRVYERLDKACGNRFDGLARIGVDETSYKKGHKYMTVVVNHDTGRVVWCAEGYGKEVLQRFFDLLTGEQKAAIKVVTADGARWIKSCIEENCPNAERVMDPFHVVSWMTDVLDEVRKQAWREARKEEKAAKEDAPKRGRGRPEKGEEKPESKASAAKGSRFAILKNPEDLTEKQQLTLERVARENKRLYRTYLLKERLRDVFKAPGAQTAKDLLESWLKSACRSAVKEVKELSKKIRRHKEAIVRSVELGISNARVEATNNKIKLTVRMGYGFRNIDNLIALIMLRCSNLPIALPRN